mgnify:CR=1 FL=1
MVNKMKISFRKIQFLFINASLFLVLQSCETLSEIPGKVLETGSDAIDYVGSVFENETEDNEIKGTNDNSEVALDVDITKNNQKNDVEVDVSKENEFLENSDQVLEAVPPEDLNVNPVKGIEEELVTNQKEPTNNEEEQANKDKSSSVENFRSELDQQTFKYQDVKLESNLILENKVQFKIATINFKSGSSLISSKDIKKIRKVIKIAADKNAQVRIVGHASTRTKDMSQLEHKLANFDISDKRSQAVAKVFVENKFPPSKLITEAVSDSKPLFHESMPAGTFGNQRTEIFIIY